MQGRLRDTTPEIQLPRSGSQSIPSNARLLLDHRVRPFGKASAMKTSPTMASADFCPITERITPYRAMQLAACCPIRSLRSAASPGAQAS